MACSKRADSLCDNQRKIYRNKRPTYLEQSQVNDSAMNLEVVYCTDAMRGYIASQIRSKKGKNLHTAEDFVDVDVRIGFAEEMPRTLDARRRIDERPIHIEKTRDVNR